MSTPQEDALTAEIEQLNRDNQQIWRDLEKETDKDRRRELRDGWRRNCNRLLDLITDRDRLRGLL